MKKMVFINFMLTLSFFYKNCLSEIPRVQTQHALIGNYPSLNMEGCGYVTPREQNNDIQQQNTRIIDGTPAKLGDFPWQATLFHKNRPKGENHLCGGVLIHKFWVMTARHCVDPNITDYKDIKAEPEVRAHELFVSFGTVVNTELFTIRDVSLIVRYPTTDLVLLQLKKEVFPEKSFDGLYYRINAICFPQEKVVNKDKESAIVSGTGNSKIWYPNSPPPPVNTLLRKALIDIDSTAECDRNNFPIHMICSTVKSFMTCQGDSGSGLIQFKGNRAVLIGIVLGGEKKRVDPVCSAGILYFLRVSHYIFFIRDVIEKGVREHNIRSKSEAANIETNNTNGISGRHQTHYFELIISLFIIKLLQKF